MYELAKLYKRAGKEHKCVETCDDLILWFGEGKYVTKAMELKMTYTPLTVSQREKYEKAVPSPGTGQPFSEKKTEPASVKIPLTSEHAGNAASLAMHTAAAAAEDVSRQDKDGETLEAKAEPSEKGSADADTGWERIRLRMTADRYPRWTRGRSGRTVFSCRRDWQKASRKYCQGLTGAELWLLWKIWGKQQAQNL